MPRSCLLGYQHETKPIATALLPVLSLPELIGVGKLVLSFLCLEMGSVASVGSVLCFLLGWLLAMMQRGSIGI
ncbi:hypothetical protein PVAP13_4KG009716 [Panicum virgatum]|uniref:Uncharacterized protein n=1 Tax=Panicum virgatum TaxID=38727 RepID=A0A8T0TMQ6_PANVG|nr:hypothetical protein PVAP13_4KG009716 [Panicum virgatum]